jgi:nitroreductase
MELEQAMRTTGTCRFFTADPVPLDTLHRASELARFAPQGGNRQSVRFLVVRDAGRRRALADLYQPLPRAGKHAAVGRRSAGLPSGALTARPGAPPGASWTQPTKLGDRRGRLPLSEQMTAQLSLAWRPAHDAPMPPR